MLFVPADSMEGRLWAVKTSSSVEARGSSWTGEQLDPRRRRWKKKIQQNWSECVVVLKGGSGSFSREAFTSCQECGLLGEQGGSGDLGPV